MAGVLTAQQIVTLACQIARVKTWTAQAGQLLNTILSDLCLEYDLELAIKTATVNLSAGNNVGTVGKGSGPYLLPADYLRMCSDEVIYRVDGVPYSMINIDLAEFDNLVQQAGISNYPEMWATDISEYAITTYGVPVLYVWPPSGGNYVPQLRYYSEMPPIQNPETSGTIPWFPHQRFLITALAGELMKVADDSRAETYLGEGPGGAQGILNRFLKLQTDTEGRAKMVKLDRRRFGRSFSRLANTKVLGW